MLPFIVNSLITSFFMPRHAIGERFPAVLRSMTLTLFTCLQQGATQKIFIMQARLEQIDRQRGQSHSLGIAG